MRYFLRGGTRTSFFCWEVLKICKPQSEVVEVRKIVKVRYRSGSSIVDGEVNFSEKTNTTYRPKKKAHKTTKVVLAWEVASSGVYAELLRVR